MGRGQAWSLITLVGGAAALYLFGQWRGLDMTLPPSDLSWNMNSYLVAYVVCYALYSAVVLVLDAIVPARFRDVVMLVSSLAFFVWMLGPEMAAVFLPGMLLLWPLLQLRRPPWWAFVLWAVVFYGSAPRFVMPMGGGIESMANFASPTNVVKMGLFVRTFKRATFALFERRVGRLPSVPVLAWLDYQLGLPFLIGNGATPSFRHFLDCRASEPDRRSAVSLHGARTVAVSMLCVVGFTFLRELMQVLAKVGHRQRFGAWWLVVLNFLAFFKYYMRRMATEQLSVGAWRIFGRDVRDDFAPDLLLSQNFVEYWRRWNVLWREYLMSTMYYPVLLRLARARGRTAPWMAGVAALLTFIGGTLFLVFPQGFFFLFDFSPAVVTLAQTMLVYHLVWGLLVGANLMWQAHCGDVVRPAPRWLVAVKIFLTLLVASLCRALYNPFVDPSAKMEAVSEVLGF